LERVGLPAVPVEREHEECAQFLAERMLPNEFLQPPEARFMPTEGELRLDLQLERREPELLESSDRSLRKRLVAEVRERGSTPQRERFTQLTRGGRRMIGERVPALGEEPLEAM